MDLEAAIAAANQGGQGFFPGSKEFNAGIPAELPQDEEGNLTEKALERVNERGIQKSLAAAIIGVGTPAVTQWVRMGQIALTLDGFIPIREVRRMTIEVAASKRRSGRPNRDGETPPQTPDGKEVHAQARLEIAKADKAELELEKLRGTLVSREEASRALAEIAVVTRTRVMCVADTATPLVLGKKEHAEVLKVLKDNLADALETLADASSS